MRSKAWPRVIFVAGVLALADACGDKAGTGDTAGNGAAGTSGGAGTSGTAGTSGGAGTTGDAGTTGTAGAIETAGTTGSAGTTGTATPRSAPKRSMARAESAGARKPETKAAKKAACAVRRTARSPRR